MILKTCARVSTTLGFFSIGLVFSGLSLTAALPQVATPIQPVTNDYHGVGVVDDYQWMENAGSPKVRDWVAEQNARTRAYFSELPFRAGLAEQLQPKLKRAPGGAGAMAMVDIPHAGQPR